MKRAITKLSDALAAERMSVPVVPTMSYEEAKKTISWWETNRKANSVEPPAVKQARMVLEPLKFGKALPDMARANPVLVETPATELTEAQAEPALSKPIQEFTLEEIPAELDRLTELAAGSPRWADRIKTLKDSLYSKRYLLKKKQKPAPAANPQKPAKISTKTGRKPPLTESEKQVFQGKTATEIFQQAESEEFTHESATDVIPQETGEIPQENSTKVCDLKTYSIAVARFNFPEIVVEVSGLEQNDALVKDVIIAKLLDQVAGIARKELAV